MDKKARWALTDAHSIYWIYRKLWRLLPFSMRCYDVAIGASRI